MLCRVNETLPYSDFAGGGISANATVNEVCDSQDGDESSNHETPSFPLSLNIDAHVAPQVFVRSVALEVSLSCINVSVVTVIPVILNVVICHDDLQCFVI